MIRDFIKEVFCDWFHGGGYVLRDQLGRVNWQCARCGRWANPVPEEGENEMIDAAIRGELDHRKAIAEMRRRVRSRG